MKTRALGLVVGFLAKAALGATETGTQLEWSANTAVGHTDNVTRVDTDPVSDTIGSVGGAIDLTREGSRVDATLRGYGAYRSYFDNTYDSDFLGSAAATIRVGLVGDSLTWTLDDTFGQTALNEVGPDTPDNRGHVNVVSTGPDLRLPMGSTTELFVFGRYKNSSYESASNVDSHSWTGGAAVVRRVSPAVAWSLNARATREVHAATDSLSSNKQEVFARLEADEPRHTLTADWGVGFLDQGDLTDIAPLIRVNWTRRLTPSWSLAFDAGSEYQSSNDQFVAGVTDGTELGGTQDVILTDLAHLTDFAKFSLSFERPRTFLRLSSGAGRERFPASASLDRNGWWVEAEAIRQVTQRLNAFVKTRYKNRDYSGSNEEDKTTTVTAGIDWRLGKALFLGVSGDTERRSGNTGFDYEETVYEVFLAYRPFEQ